MTCDEVRRRIARPGGLEAGTYREFEAADLHMEGCPACTVFLGEHDPLRVFRSLAEEVPDDAFRAGLWAGVRAGVQEEGRLGPLESLALLRPAYRVAMAAAVVLASGLLALSTLQWGPPPAGPEPAVVFLPDAAVEAASLPTIESIDSAQAQIYDMKVFGDEGQVTELVLIFDEEIDL